MKLKNKLIIALIVFLIFDIYIAYKGSARAGDTIQIKTHMEKARNVSFTMGQSVFLDNTLILKARITNVFIDMIHQKAVKPNNALITDWSDLCACLENVGVRNG